MVRYKEVKAPVAIYAPEQVSSILGKADGSLIPYIALGAFAGLRTAELECQDWKDIHLDRGFIEVAAHKAKTRQRRLVPISDNLKQWLMPYRQESGPIAHHQRPQLAAKTLCEGFKWVFNGLHHSCISYRLALLNDTARVALESGNSPEVIFEHYRELVTPEAARAWFSVVPKALAAATD